MPDSSVKITDELNIYFDISVDPGVFVVKYDNPGQFFAVGFGEGMADADVWVFEISDNGIVSARDCYSDGYSSPSNDDF